MGYYIMQTKDQSAKRLLAADMQSNNSLRNQVEGTIQRLICEAEEFQKKIDQINTELQLLIISYQKLSNKRIELIIEPQSFIYSNQKLSLLDNKIEKYHDERIVYRNQVLYIQKWMEVIEKLVTDVHAIVLCIESQQLCSELGYDFEDSYANEIAVKVVDLIVKFNKENVEFLDILLLSKFEEIKNLQANTNIMNKLNKNMEELNKEVSDFKIYKKEELFTKRYHLKTVVQNQGGLWSTIYSFGSWIGSILFRFLSYTVKTILLF